MTQSFPVQDSILSASALGELVHRRYALEAVPVCTFWRKGMTDAYRIQAGSQVCFLKVSKVARRTRRDVEEEVRLLLHLAEGGIGVCLPIPTIEGEHILTLSAPEGERYAVLYEAAEGVEGDTEQHRREFGRIVARMHLRADSLEPAYDRDHFELSYVLDDSLTAIEPVLSHRPDDYDTIARIAQHAKDVVTGNLPRGKPEHGVCHGDLFGGDVRYAPDGTPTIFDFDSSGCGWRALDIAVFQGSPDWMDTSREAELKREQEVGQFLDGYTSVRALSSGELEVLKLDQAVHHIFLMGLALRFWSIHNGWHWANDGFIDWHMKWFNHWIEHHKLWEFGQRKGGRG